MQWRAILCVVILLVMGLDSGLVSADSTYNYHTYAGQRDSDFVDQEPANTFRIKINPSKEDIRVVEYFEKSPTNTKKETYSIDEEWQTVEWTASDMERKLQYTGRRLGDRIFLKGYKRGKALVRTLQIDSDPFYFNPKVGLQYFAKSGLKELEFWGMRHDKLTAHKMLAEHHGVESIEVNGEQVDAYRIYWTAKAGFAKYFSRNYWFRVSDGAYVKQKSFGGRFKVLVNEQ